MILRFDLMRRFGSAGEGVALVYFASDRWSILCVGSSVVLVIFEVRCCEQCWLLLTRRAECYPTVITMFFV